MPVASRADASPPTGTVTFLFTDIEGSTRIWEAHPDAMQVALAHHDAMVRKSIVAENGYVFKTVGDAFCAAFARGPEAVAAALRVQRALAAGPWPAATPIKVRIALHTGAVEARDQDYFGPPLNRVARLLATGYGGQTLLSQATYELCRDALPAGVSLRDLGAHRLKDLARPEQVYELAYPGYRDDFPPIKSLSTHPNNLPQQLTSFIGREKAIADVETLLRKARLVTLTGAGGSGKTRLSLQVAAEALAQFPDGAWFVELAPFSEPALVPQAVAAVLGIAEEGGRPISHTLAENLRSKRLLLLLDNCEHLRDACAVLADNLLRQCPDVRILASSREALGIAGEQTYRVPSMSLPDRTQAHVQTAQSLSTYEAVRLFIDRAVLLRPDFAVTNRNAPALASLCCHLDGIPLAIELAAARVRALSVEEIDGKLDERFRLLTGGSRTALPRHQTLRALIDWSYDLLRAPEQLLLQRLSVFTGGCTLAAAEQVCTGGEVANGDVLDLLTSVADKSLVLADYGDGHSRYGML
jgi:predicted ATPase/class 3 adenylate cyclase